MPYVIQAVIQNPHTPDYGVATIPFPLSREVYEPTLREIIFPLDIGDAVTQDCLVKEVDSSYDYLKCLEGQTVNFDELDYLAKRLDSFSDTEAVEFQAACHAFGCKDIRSLINMTFCCGETTVFSDFSKLEQIGKEHYLTIHGGTAPSDELANVDGKALAQALIQSGEGMTTPYGLFFRNGMRMEEPYRGQGFPPYLWDERNAELEIIKPDKTKSFFFLPFTPLELERFQKREGISDISDCKCILRLYQRQGKYNVVQGGTAELEEWNKLCDALNGIPYSRQQAFAAALEVTDAEDLFQMRQLAASLEDFHLIPGVKDAESYGRYMIQKSGKYDYDESLDCYYNYEALGEFLMEHEVGQFTEQGYLKCEEDSVFLDFFTPDEPDPPSPRREFSMKMEGM